MAWRLALTIAILSAAFQPHPVHAQTAPCPVCRAMAPFPDCDDAAVAQPPSGAVGVVGTVVETNLAACGTGISMDVIRSLQAALPQRITVDRGPCLLWNGRPGDTIRIVVDATPLPDGSYRLRACK